MIKKFLKAIYVSFLRKKLASLGENSIIRYPYRIEGKGKIQIGKNVSIFGNCHFQTLTIDGSEPILLFGNNIRMWYNSQISCVNSIVIEDGCTFASNCFITDVTHTYEDINNSAYSSKLKKLPNVIIGKGTWVGRNVIISGAKIGKHCVIGAGTMVSIDIPDYCVVVGNPARIVKRYNPLTALWEKTDKDGKFI